MLEWLPHPFLPSTWYALTKRWSFLCLRDQSGEPVWETSWQDRYNGGSASNTREGPFSSLKEAKENCERIRKELVRKN